MTEYISREELIEALKNDFNRSWCSKLPGAEDEYNDARRIIYDIQATDVQPVVHAEWVCLEAEIGFYSCSKCRHNILRATCNYCPNCGAKMDGEQV